MRRAAAAVALVALAIALAGCGGGSTNQKNKTFGGTVPPPQPNTRGTTTTSGY